ncbi:hypothetical protein MMC22_001688 [Lobaria immixta]|nr:hypothetical protein [Lobaria immixta]
MRQGSQRRQDRGFRIRIGALKAPPPRGKGAEAVTWASLRELTKSCRASNRWVSCPTFSPERMAAPSGLESQDTAHLSRAKDGSGFATTEIGQYLRHPNAASHRGTTEAYLENPAHKFFNDRVDPEYVRPWVYGSPNDLVSLHEDKSFQLVCKGKDSVTGETMIQAVNKGELYYSSGTLTMGRYFDQITAFIEDIPDDKLENVTGDKGLICDGVSFRVVFKGVR